MKSLSNLVKLLFLTHYMWKQMREMTADQQAHGDRYMCQAWSAVRGSASYHPQRRWTASPTNAQTQPAISADLRHFATIFVLASIYAAAIGVIGGLTEVVGFPRILSLTICLSIGTPCILQLYGMVCLAVESRHLADLLQSRQAAGCE